MNYKIDGLQPSIRAADAAKAAGGSRVSGAERSDPVAASGKVDSVSLTGDAEGLQAMGREMGASPAGIDMAKVNAVRAALAGGTYRIDAQAIASRMLDLDQQLGG